MLGVKSMFTIMFTKFHMTACYDQDVQMSISECTKPWVQQWRTTPGASLVS